MDLPRGINRPVCPVVRKYEEKTKDIKPVKLETVLVYNSTISLKQLEVYWIQAALNFFGGNVTQAAKALGIGKSTLDRKLQLGEVKRELR